MNSIPVSDAVVVFQSELDYLSRCILDYPDIETGGQLFGYWTSTGVPVVLYAIGPGPMANHQHAFFNQDIDYLETIGGFLTREFGLQHIGEWHSHHRLGLSHPSKHDARTVSVNMQRHQLPRFLLCIGNVTRNGSSINAFNFINTTRHYQRSKWEVMAIDSPFRKIIDQRLDGYLSHPFTSRPILDGMQYRRQRGVKCPPGYWLNDKSNHQELKQMLDYLQNLYPGCCGVSLDEQGLAHIAVKDYERVLLDVMFPMGFPERHPIVTNEYEGLCATGAGWEPKKGALAQSFCEYFNLHAI